MTAQTTILSSLQFDDNKLPKMKYRDDRDQKIVRHRRHGQVQLERKDADLLINGKKIILYVSPSQKRQQCKSGLQLWSEVKHLKVLNANIMYFLADHSELIPEDWKVNKKGTMPHICFWGSQFKIGAEEKECDVIETLYFYPHVNPPRWMTGGMFVKVPQTLGTDIVSAIIGK